MNDNKIFADSNVLLYLLSDIEAKKTKAFQILSSRPTISTQVLSEKISVCTRKFRYTKEQSENHLHSLIENGDVKMLTTQTIQSALDLHYRFGYSYYDSQIIAAALENDCSILYSEDLQHNHQLDDRLKIVNPFKIVF